MGSEAEGCHSPWEAAALLNIQDKTVLFLTFSTDLFLAQCHPHGVGFAWWDEQLTGGDGSCSTQHPGSEHPLLLHPPGFPTQGKPSQGLAESQAELAANLFLLPFQGPARGLAVCLQPLRSLLEMLGACHSREEAALPPSPHPQDAHV